MKNFTINKAVIIAVLCAVLFGFLWVCEANSRSVSDVSAFESTRRTPVIDLDGSTAGYNYTGAYTENGSGSAIVNTDMTLTSTSGTHCKSATVTIASVASTDSLDVSLVDAKFDASYDVATGVATLTGPYTYADYKTALKAIKYLSTSDNLADGTKSISIVTSAGENSNTATCSMVLTAVNDAPVVDLGGSAAGTGWTAAYTEGGSAVAVSSSEITITDPDDTYMESAVITLTNKQTGDSIDTGAVELLGLVSVAKEETGGDITVTLTGHAVIASYLSAIQVLTFSNSSDNPSETPRTITVVVNDGTNNSASTTCTVSVTGVNDAPALDLGNNTGWAFSYVGGSAATSIASDEIALTDADDTYMETAQIVLTNMQSNDTLETATVNAEKFTVAATTADGSVTVLLTGHQTIADYKTAILAVKFYNPDTDSIDLTARVVTVVVDDGTAASNTCTSTITVSAP